MTLPKFQSFLLPACCAVALYLDIICLKKSKICKNAHLYCSVEYANVFRFFTINFKTLFLTILFSVAVVSISTVICTYLSQYSKN